MKKLMILGASEPQARLTRAAKELGYYTLVVSPDGNYPGLLEADKCIYLDIKDKENVLQAARNENIDGIISCCFDVPLETIGYVNDQLHLNGLSSLSAQLASDKLKMKEVFEKYGVNSAKYRKVKSLPELELVMDQLKFPMILKAVDLAGSVGIFKIQDKEEGRIYFNEVMKLTHKDYCIIEEFIEGVEFGAQAFVNHGNIEFILIHGDTTYVDHTAMPIGHYVPYQLSEELEEKAKETCRRAIESLQLKNCAVNIDLILKDNEVYMIELTGRAGATCCCELVSIYYGIDYYKAIAMLAVSENPSVIFQGLKNPKTANASLLLMSLKDGVVKKIINNNLIDAPYIYELSLDVKEGDQVKKYRSSKDKIGQIVVKGDTYEECEKYLENVKNNLIIEIE